MWQRLFSVEAYDTPLRRERARMIYGISLLLLVTYTLFFLLFSEQIPGEPGTIMQGALAGHPLPLIAVLGVYGSWLLIIHSTNRGRLTLAAVGVIIQMLTSGVLIGFLSGFVDPADGMIVLVFVMLGGLLLYERGLVIAGAIAVALIGLRVILGAQGILPAPNLSINDGLIVSIIVVGTGALVYLFLRSTRISRIEALTQSSEEQLRLAAITAKIAGLVNRRQPLESVMTTTIDEILRGYPTVYHAQIFLNDEVNEYARLAASTGPVGDLLLSRKHALAVGSQSVIGQVTATGKTVIARAGAKDGIHKRNELLPDTQVEVALPLIANDRVIGALDVQSRQIESFLEAEIPTLEALADTVAVAIDNARLYDERDRQLAENEALVAQMQGAMSEVERLNRQLTGIAWSDYLRPQSEAVNLDYKAGESLTPNETWTPTLRESAQNGAVVQRQEGSDYIVSLPLRVRGVIIGAAEYAFPRPVETETLSLLQTALDRFSTAAESLRLFEDAQRATVQEQRVNDIAARYQQVTSIDELLSVTVAELSQTLGAREGSIRLGRLPTEANGMEAEGASS